MQAENSSRVEERQQPNKAPPRSCLKERRPLAEANSRVSNQPRNKRVTFHFPPSTKIIPARSDPVVQVPGKLRKILSESPDQLRNTLFKCLDIIEQRSQDNKLTPIFVNFQIGTTDDFLFYFWTKICKDGGESEEQQNILLKHWSLLNPCHIDPQSPVLPEQPSILVLRAYDSVAIDEVIAAMGNTRHVLMLVSNLQGRLELNGWINGDNKDRVYFINFALTHFDFEDRMYLDTRGHDVPRCLAQTGGIPLAMRQLMYKYPLDTIDGLLYQHSSHTVRNILRQLFIMYCKCYTVTADWQVDGISYLDIALTVGLLLIDTKTKLLATPDVSFASFDKDQNEIATQKSYHIVWPDLLKARYMALNPSVKRLYPGPGLTAPEPMEYFILQNLTNTFIDCEITYGSRFNFFRTSYIKQCSFSSALPLMLPKILGPKESKKNVVWSRQTPLSEIAAMMPDDFWELIQTVPAGRMLTFRPQSCSPDMMAVFPMPHDKGTIYRILAVQVKSGTESHNDLDLIDEIAKCQLFDVSKDFGFRHIEFKDHLFPCSVTFVFAAMNSSSLVTYLKANNFYLSKEASQSAGYIRCTHESWKVLPPNVEVIVLLQAGLVQLLGCEENYDFVKNYKPHEVAESEAATFLDEMSDNSLETLAESLRKDVPPGLDANMLHAGLRAAVIEDISESDMNTFFERVVKTYKKLKRGNKPMHNSESIDSNESETTEIPSKKLPSSNKRKVEAIVSQEEEQRANKTRCLESESTSANSENDPKKSDALVEFADLFAKD